MRALEPEPMTLMADRKYPNRIRHLRRRLGLSQRDLADRIGMHWVTVSKLERGEMKLTQFYLEAFSIALKTSEEELIAERPLVRNVVLEGIIGMNGIEDNNKNMFKDIEEFSYQVEFNNAAASSWFMTDGFVFGKIAGDADLVRFSDLPDLPEEERIGRYCLLEDSDGSKFVGTLQRGAAPETYDLETADGARISGLKPKTIKMLTTAIAFPSRRSRSS